jgi:hypothetical protein
MIRGEKVELIPGGYERIIKKIQTLTNTVNRGVFNPDLAVQFLRETNRGLYELRQILNDVCLLVPDTPDPPGPGAA